MNPQIRFGEDLMSRVSYGIMNPGGAGEMTTAVIGGLQTLIDGAVERAGLQREDVVEIVLVGNPVMHHLLLGIDPIELGGAPFALALDNAVEISASDIGLVANQGARVYVLPCIAGHVGADAAAVVLAEAPQKSDEMMLIVDVGTNAEIVVGNKQRCWRHHHQRVPHLKGRKYHLASAPRRGPLNVSALIKIHWSPFPVIGVDQWSDEDGFDAAIAKPGITGICGSGYY